MHNGPVRTFNLDEHSRAVAFAELEIDRATTHIGLRQYINIIGNTKTVSYRKIDKLGGPLTLKVSINPKLFPEISVLDMMLEHVDRVANHCNDV
jgi:hypothetical protein